MLLCVQVYLHHCSLQRFQFQIICPELEKKVLSFCVKKLCKDHGSELFYKPTTWVCVIFNSCSPLSQAGPTFLCGNLSLVFFTVMIVLSDMPWHDMKTNLKLCDLTLQINHWSWKLFIGFEVHLCYAGWSRAVSHIDSLVMLWMGKLGLKKLPWYGTIGTEPLTWFGSLAPSKSFFSGKLRVNDSLWHDRWQCQCQWQATCQCQVNVKSMSVSQCRIKVLSLSCQPCTSCWLRCGCIIMIIISEIIWAKVI